jgi:CRP-like cAMP-binding protein
MKALEATRLMRQDWLTQYWDRARPEDWAQVLATFPLFSGTSRRRLRKLVRQAAFAEFASGEEVVARGAATNSLYLILGGTAKARGKPAARVLRTGDYFGELALLGGASRSATVVATQQLHVMRLPRESFLRVAQHDPSIWLTMLRSLSAQFARLETQAAQP